jgi:hypothetical protein
MRKRATRLLITAFTVSIVSVPAILHAQTETKTNVLKQAAAIQAEKERITAQQLLTLAQQKGWELVMKGKNGNIAYLTGVDAGGYPQYTITESNIAAAATIGTSQLWPGGATGLALSGSSNAVKNKLAVWDGGKVLNTHVELTGRVTQRDAATAVSDHATHVAGTLVAAGVNPLAKGMSFGQQELYAYDFGNDNSEMLTEASNLLVSNHSYGEIAGWYYNDGASPARWEFRGRFGENEDYKMGYYSDKTQLWDSIAYNAPYYLIVKSAGNKRTENGPAEGATYWRYNASGIMENAGPRPAGISSNNGYDIIPSYGTAKNLLSIAAVNPIPNGYTKASDVVMSTFSSWGPTDDGRIKPDVSADGVNLMSSIGSSNNAYDVYSGTSMASPNAAGSLLLLQEYYNRLHTGTFLRSSTLKALVIHTAEEAGNAPGPDYQFGWGLINVAKAAAVITANNTTDRIHENVLNQGQTFTQTVVASGRGPVVATIAWTDPKGDVEPSNSPSVLNNPAKKLVHDLDLVIKKGATVYRTWRLDPASPSSAATTGDNNTDNVEKVVIDDVVPGETYTIEITHKGTLQRSSQAYGLIISGVGGTAYCTSNPTVNTGARIDSVSFGALRKQNPAGCTSYTNNTNLTVDVQPNQTIPLYIKLNSCDATIADKVVKAFIDYNNDGDFEDAGENIGTSGTINGDGVYTANITTPGTLRPGFYTILRIVAVETNSAATVLPCGTYAKGETQDYRVRFAVPANDVGPAELVSPNAIYCAAGQQYVTVRIHNYGTTSQNNIPIQAVVKQGTTTIATLNATITNSIVGDGDGNYTFQTPIATTGNTAYTVTVTTNLTGDQFAANNSYETTFNTRADATAPTGAAEICTSNSVFLTAQQTPGDLFTWYATAASTTPLATGANTSTTTVTGNSTYYLVKNDQSQRVGPVDKLAFPTGGYNIFVNNLVRFTADQPFTIETARLFIGQPGKITILLRRLTQFNQLTGAYSYFPVSSKVIDVYATSPTTPALGAQVNDPADAGAIYHLGIDVPMAGDYALVIQCDGASIYRNNNITGSNYPYQLPGIMSITGNGAVDNVNSNYFQGFYYFFYNVGIRLPFCGSARTPIVATTAVAPVITQNGNVLTSSAATFNQWYFNGGPIPGAGSTTYTATQSGVYKVVRTDEFGCTLSSNEITLTVTSVPNVDPSEIKLVVSPNPSRGPLDLKLETRTKDDLVITMINATGQRIYAQTIKAVIGRMTTTINPGTLAAGVYYLRLEHDKKAYNQKIVIIP